MIVPSAIDKDAKPDKHCSHCGLTRKGYRPDPCIGGYLEGVAHACCGHGNPELAYVVGWKGCYPDEIVGKNVDDPTYWRLEGEEAIEFIQLYGGENGCDCNS